MSLTSYQTAPPRVENVLLEERAGSHTNAGPKNEIVKKMAVVLTRHKEAQMTNNRHALRFAGLAATYSSTP